MLWRRSPLLAQDVQQASAGDGRDLAKTSAITTLDTLVMKKYLNRRKEGNSFLFLPRISAEEVAVLVLVALTPLFVQAGAPTPATAELTEPALSPLQAPPTLDAKHREPRIIIAEHVLLWDDQIVTWDEVVARLRTMRESGPFRAHFYTTNGLHAKDGWKDYHDRIMKLYREIFEPVGVSFGSLSPKGSARWDAIRTADDLRPDPKRMRSGQVVTPQGERARDAQVIVLPTAGPFAASDVILSGAQMRDPLNEQWSSTDEIGHFVVHPTYDSYHLAILGVTHPGFAPKRARRKTWYSAFNPGRRLRSAARATSPTRRQIYRSSRPAPKPESPVSPFTRSRPKASQLRSRFPRARSSCPDP